MKSTTLTNSIDNLTEQDLYSVVLQAIYLCTKDPQYSTLSQLIYTVNKDSLLNLCSIFGGQTIRIPTRQELSFYVNVLLIYTMTAKGDTFSEAFNKTSLTKSDRDQAMAVYQKIDEVIKNVCQH